MIEQKLIEKGIKNLNQFGYPDVNKDNIFTDLIYSQMFKSMLEDNKGHRVDIDTAIDNLLAKINDVSQQRELLLAWEEYCCKLEHITPNYEVLDKNINDFLANNCG